MSGADQPGPADEGAVRPGDGHRSAPPAWRLRALAVAVLLGVFAAGTAFGAGLSRHLRDAPPHGAPPHGAPPHGAPPHGPPPPGDPFHRLVRELGLDDAQQARLRALGEQHRPVIEALVQEFAPRLRAARDAVEQELRPHLSEEQRRRLDAVQARRPPPESDLGPPPGPPPHGPPPGPPPHDLPPGPPPHGPPPGPPPHGPPPPGAP